MKIIMRKEVKKIMDRFKSAGFEVYLVGGCVRDMLLKRPTDDWDFATNATPSEIQKLFPDSFYNNYFGTVGVPVAKLVFEITTFRSEYGYSDHRHPDKIVWGKTIEDDLQRRDFTINAMAFNGVKIVDFHDGEGDLKNKIIRAVGDAGARFNEDALRMMRAIRLATTLRFVIENDTFDAIRKNAHLINKISEERLRDELLKILQSEFAVDGFLLLRNSGLLSFIIPELDKCFGVAQKSPKRHHQFDVGTHLIESLRHCPSNDPIVRLATLLHDIGKPLTVKTTAEGVITFYNHEIIGASIVRNIAQRLHFPKADREKILKLVRYHQFTVDERQTDSAIRRFIRNIGKENLEDMLALRVGDRLGGGARETSWRLELYRKRLIEVQKQPFGVADLHVDGHDVMEVFNIRPSRLVGEVLNILYDDVVKKIIKNERKVLLKRITDLKKIMIAKEK